MDMIDCVATCRPGLEGVLADELGALRMDRIQPGKRAVRFSTDQAGLYRVNMALQTAIQVLVPLRTFNARDYDLLYYQARRTNWHQYFEVGKNIRIDVNGRSGTLRNTQYVVHRVKDGIVDTFRKLSGGIRPSVDKDQPDIHVVVHLDGQKVTLSLDSSGVPLFKRGYRTSHGGAPLKEDLAAGILLLAGIRESSGLLDPMCGSGTFLFEGWMLLHQVAPNLEREFSFQHWLDYDEAQHVRERDQLRRLERRDREVPVWGCDLDPSVRQIAQGIREAHFPEAGIRIDESPFEEWEVSVENGLLVANPPYGERMGVSEELGQLYRDLGNAAKRMVPGGRLGVFTTNRKAARQIRLTTDRALTLFNGALEGLLYLYSVKKLQG